MERREYMQGRRERQEYMQGSSARELAHTSGGAKKRVQTQAPVRTVQKSVKQSHYALGHVVTILMIAGILGTIVGGYISLHSDIIHYRNQCTSLQKEYETLKTSNDLYKDRIINGVDMAEIERIAVCELGMTLAQEGQIVRYSGEIEDYVKQYADIP